jgi:hypothetical protein
VGSINIPRKRGGADCRESEEVPWSEKILQLPHLVNFWAGGLVVEGKIGKDGRNI